MLREHWAAHAFLLLSLSLWVGTFPMVLLYGGTWLIINTILGTLSAGAAVRTYFILIDTHEQTLHLTEDAAEK